MSWTITPQYRGAAVSDPDAQAYLRAVETADGQSLEPAVALAVNNFVIGCKSDGIWTALKASCILAGARTLAGALMPLAGTAPTPFNFVSGDYNRKTGLVGDGSTKYLNSNRASNADPQNSLHTSVYITAAGLGTALSTRYTVNTADFNTIAIPGALSAFITNRESNTVGSDIVTTSAPIGLLGSNRSVSSSYRIRVLANYYTINGISYSPSIHNYLLFARNQPTLTSYSNSRLAFYSIGESLDLALLDARVTALITAFGVAIP